MILKIINNTEGTKNVELWTDDNVHYMMLGGTTVAKGLLWATHVLREMVRNPSPSDTKLGDLAINSITFLDPDETTYIQRIIF